MNILITRHDKIGDFVTMLPVCKVLKEQTGHKIVMLVSRVNVDLAKAMDFIDEVIEYSENRKILIDKIKPYHFDVSISGYIDTALGKVLFASGIPLRIAPATKFAQIFFNKRVKQRRSRVEKREFQYNLDLLHAFDKSLRLDFPRPLLEVPKELEKERIVFHPGFGGSSDGNLSLDDYLKLAKKASAFLEVVFTFGPDDEVSKVYIEKNLNFDAVIKDDFESLLVFTHYIADSKLFISTSTGPMHLAGLTNTPTLSFFGDTLFASPKRWGTLSEEKCQHNFTVPKAYDEAVYRQIEQSMVALIDA